MMTTLVFISASSPEQPSLAVCFETQRQFDRVAQMIAALPCFANQPHGFIQAANIIAATSHGGATMCATPQDSNRPWAGPAWSGP
jgi:hypothetical protein